MNLHVLQQNITDNITTIYPTIMGIFENTIAAAANAPHGINIRPFISRLNAALKQNKIRIIPEWTKKYGGPEILSGNYYPSLGAYCFYPSRQNTPARIHIFLCLHPKHGRLQLSPESWQYFRYRFLKIIIHELVHRAQFANGRKLDNGLIFRPHSAAKLNIKDLKEQEYLGDIDEVEAYARECVEEWYYLFPNTPLTMALIRKTFREKGGSIPAIQYYYDAYFGDITHPSVRRLFRKIKIWNDITTPISTELPMAPEYVKLDAEYPPKVVFKNL